MCKGFRKKHLENVFFTGLCGRGGGDLKSDPTPNASPQERGLRENEFAADGEERKRRDDLNIRDLIFDTAVLYCGKV